MDATTTPRAGLALIKHYEGCKLSAYPDPATGNRPWTIGYGHTLNVKPGQTCTQARAEAWLLSDYDRFEANVRAMLTRPVNTNQLGALTSLAFNVGPAKLKSSTLLALVNAGEFKAAAAEFLKWNHAGGRVLIGLTVRRATEAALFTKPPA